MTRNYYNECLKNPVGLIGVFVRHFFFLEAINLQTRMEKERFVKRIHGRGATSERRRGRSTDDRIR